MAFRENVLRRISGEAPAAEPSNAVIGDVDMGDDRQRAMGAVYQALEPMFGPERANRLASSLRFDLLEAEPMAEPMGGMEQANALR